MAETTPILIYGSYGYTGRLIVDEALARGLRPVLGGRDAQQVRQQCREHGLEPRVFSMSDGPAVDAALEDMTAVIHCAGPFAHTYETMAQACLRTRTHYVDITGEVEVFQGLAALDGPAREAGVMLLPGAGFDVVPSDCLAAHLAARMPGAVSLTLAFEGLGGGMSRGTARTMIQNLHRGGLARVAGDLTPVPLTWRTRTIELVPDKPVHCMTIPWGDVYTAFHTTGIQNIAVYVPVPRKAVWALKAAQPLRGLLGTAPIQRFLEARVAARSPGPSAEERRSASTRLYGEVHDAAGDTEVARLITPEGYTLTAAATVLVARRILGGDAPPGYQTPAGAYGEGLVLELEGVKPVAW